MRAEAMGMLPFHKRARTQVYEEVDASDVPLVEEPAPVRRPVAFGRDEERTLIMPSKRPSTAPPPPSFRAPRPAPLPTFSARPSVSDEVTQVHPSSSRAVLSLAARPAKVAKTPKAPPVRPTRMSIGSMVREELASSLEPSQVFSAPPPPPVSTPHRAGDSVPAMAMSVAPDLSGATVLVRTAPGRPTAVWALALVACGLFGGLLTSIVTRGELAVNATQPTAFAPAQEQHVAAAAAQQQAPIVQQQIPAALADALHGQSSAVPCNVDPAPAPPPAPPTKAIALVTAQPTPVVDAKPAPKAVAYVARPAAKAVPAPAKQEVAVAKPVVKPAAKAKALGDDMEQANAADALARAQLEAALNR